MKTYLIGYDLNKIGQNYKDLISKIKETFGTWWHHLDSTPIVKSDLSAVQIRDLLKPLMDINDELLVVALTGEGACFGFDEKGSNWLKKYL